MKHLTQAECIEICKLINPNLKWEWNDHFNIEDQPYYAVNGLGSSTELFMIKIYYNHDKITIIDGNNEIMEEKIVKFQSNKKILQILDNNHSKVNEITSNSKDDSSKFVLKKYVDKITDKFSTIIEYRMKKSSILNNNDGLPYTYKFDLNVRIFVENNDFLNSKIVLVLTFYAPEPGTGTILHESFADVMIDNKIFFKLDNEYSYSALDYYGATGYKLDLCDEDLAIKSSRIEQIQFYIDLETLIKIVNAKTFEIRFNKKWEYGGKLSSQELMKIIGLYNAIFDNNFMKDKIISLAKYGHELNNKSIKKLEKNRNENKNNVEKTQVENKIRVGINAKNDNKILEYCKQGKKTDAITFRKDLSGEDIVASKKYVEDLCSRNGVNIETQNPSKCFVITATMNNPNHPIVDEFRAFRDTKLLPNILGKAFVSFYYKIGPFLALIISKSPLLRTLSYTLLVNPIYRIIKNDNRKK